MNTRSLRVGVVGVGFGATVHVPGFQSEGWEVPALWSRRRERALEAAARLEVPDVHDDWRELVARDDLDAVAVATPPAAHLEIVRAAIEAGKHVLCEKPFALDLGEAIEMRELARRHGRVAMVAHEFRFAPQRAQIKELIEEGAIGEPQLAALELFLGRPAPATPPPLTWGARAAEGGGSLGALGSHYIDGLRHWFGDVESASGTVLTLRPERLDPATNEVVRADADDAFTFTLRFVGGVVATMTASLAVSPALGARITVTGSEGVLVATQRGPNPEPDGIVLAGKAGDRELHPLSVPDGLRPFEDERDHRLMAFRLLVREFARGIHEGVSPAPSFEDAAACQAVLDAVRRSSRVGSSVMLA